MTKTLEKEEVNQRKEVKEAFQDKIVQKQLFPVFRASPLMLILFIVRRHRLLKTKKFHIHNIFITYLQRVVSIPSTFKNNVMLNGEGPLSHESNFKAIQILCGVIQRIFLSNT